MNQELITKLYTKAPESIRNFITSKELDDAIIDIALLNKVNISNYAPLKNAAILVLLGATEPNDVENALEKTMSLSHDAAHTLTQALNTTIFERARGIVLKGDTEVRAIKVAGSGEENKGLRNTIIDATKTPSINNPKATLGTQNAISSEPGSRTELMVQLELIGQIPKDEDVKDRLEKIRAQLQKANEGEVNTVSKPIDTTEQVSEEAPIKAHQYFPKEYAVDPYRELA